MKTLENAKKPIKMNKTTEFEQERQKILKSFQGAPKERLEALDGLISQAAHEKVYLNKFNQIAAEHGLIVTHPENAMMQRTIPISAEILKHGALYTNIIDKLMKHLSADDEEDDTDLEEYE